jgi:hypothetical protein
MKFKEEVMQVGNPQREIYIEPLELPEPLRVEPSIEPSYTPEVPEAEPVKVGDR